MKPEDEAQQHIDELLTKAGWSVQDYEELNLGASQGVAVRYFPLPNREEADYLLFVDREAVGVIEAKPEGTTLSGVSEQSEKYITNLPDEVARADDPLPFAYESTGVETLFRDLRDPDPRSRRVFAFHRPDELRNRVEQENTLRSRLQQMPPLIEEGLRPIQTKAIKALEKSLAENRPRALVQMASGSGKTYTAVNATYRLVKHAKAKRVLFLVDRRNLGQQTLKEFMQFSTPDDGRKFTNLYNVQHLTSNVIDPSSKVVITTIQRLFSMLKGEDEYGEEAEEESIFELSPSDGQPREVSYNPDIPIETFDFIITDECHRSIYNLWRQVLEYFDAFLIGLTATPSKQTLAFFNQNLVTEYRHDHAVADGINVGYDVYRIKTKISEEGSAIEENQFVDIRDKPTRKVRWEQLDEEFEYSSNQLDRDVVAEDQIRTIIRTFRDEVRTKIFPDREEVPKTLIFAKDDSHAEDIVHIVREEFGRGNDFCKKITYRTSGEDPDTLIRNFRMSYNPRIAVTVDMISTGVDIRPLECLIFMRDVKSRVYFEQMKGRGTRTISSDDLRKVTPDTQHKTHFVIVDAVGVCDHDKTDSRPLERKRHVPFEKLLDSVATGNRDPDSLTSLANRLARFDRQLTDEQRAEIEETADGQSFSDVINGLLDATDPDVQQEYAQEKYETEEPTDEQIQKASKELVDQYCQVFDSPQFRNKIKDVKQRNEQVIDKISRDEATVTGFSEEAKERAESIVQTFEEFIEENKDEITALEIIYEKPYAQRHVTYGEIKELAEKLQAPPYNLSSEAVWNAYRQLEQSKVKGAGPQKLLTNIISLVRFTVGESTVLEPFPDIVDRRFEEWLQEQRQEGAEFSEEQLWWLRKIKDHIATSLSVEMDDLEYDPFQNRGGAFRAYKLFGEDLEDIMEELNEVLVK